MTEPVCLEDLPAPPAGRTGWPWTEAPPPLPRLSVAGRPWPRFSVVTPSFNQAATLEETIRSVLLQGYPALEYFVVDGGSSDASAEIIRRYAPWLSGWRSEPDRGQSHAINLALERAGGEIAAWLNSDDLYLPGALRAAAEAFAARPEAAVVYGNAQLIDSAGSYAEDCYAAPYDRALLLTEANPIPQPAAFFRLSAFRAAGGLDEDLHFAMDYDLWLRLEAHGALAHIPAMCAQMRVYRGAKTASGDQRMFVEIERVSRRHGGPGLPARFQSWLVSLHAPRAFDLFRQGQDEAAGRELAYLHEYAPAWGRDRSRLAREIAAQAWQRSPGLTGDDCAVIDFAGRVCRRLPPALAVGDVRRKTLAAVYEACAFRSARRGRALAAWRFAGRAVAQEAARLSNRGLWAGAARAAWSRNARRSWDGRALGRQLPALIARALRLTPDAQSKSGRLRLSPANGAPSLEAAASLCALDLAGGLGWLAEDEAGRWRAFLHGAYSAADGAAGYASLRALWLQTEALHRLGAPPARLPGFVEDLRSPARVRAWLKDLDWRQPDWTTSLDWGHPRLQAGAAAMFLVSLYIYTAARSGEPAYAEAAGAALDWLDERQDPERGYWLLGRSLTRVDPLLAAGHFAHLYCALGRPLRYVDALIDTTLGLQQLDGHFDAQGRAAPYADLTAVDLLVRLSLESAAQAARIKTALAYAFEAILAAWTAEAGPPDPPDPCAAHARLSALALISSRYPGEFIEGVDWQFGPPGLPGWRAPA